MRELIERLETLTERVAKKMKTKPRAKSGPESKQDTY